MRTGGDLRGAEPIYSLPRMLYHTGSPVLITEGGLLRGRDGQLFCRLLLQNVGVRKLRSVTVAVQPLDGEDSPLGSRMAVRSPRV